MTTGKIEPQDWGPILPGLGADIVQLLEIREGLQTQFHLDDGSVIDALSFGWGRDFGELWEHVYLTTSLDRKDGSTHFVQTENITQITDPLKGRILYSRQAFEHS